AVPMISDESRKLIMRWPAFQQELESMAGYIISQREALPDFMTTFIDNMIGVVSDSISGAVADVVSIVTDTVATLFMIIIITLFLFFILKDHEKFIHLTAVIFSAALKSFVILHLMVLVGYLKSFVLWH